MIKGIIFDIGHVVQDEDWQAMADAFLIKPMSGPEYKAFTMHERHRLLNLYETGKMDAETFYGTLLEEQGIDPSQENIAQFQHSQQQFLTPADLEVIAVVRSLPYQKFALSNSTPDWAQSVDPLVREVMEKVYFSQDIGHRKPSPESFQALMDDAGITDPGEYLFIDDQAHNVEAAQKLGFQTYHKTDKNKLLDYLRSLQ